MEQLGIWGNVTTYRVLGIIFLVVSIGYFFTPKFMAKIDQIGRKLLWSDKWTTKHRMITGTFFLAAAIFFFWTGARVSR